MARNHARIHVSAYDPEAGFTGLELDEQGLYWMLVARRDISACGVVPYKPKVWAQRTGSSFDAVWTALAGLVADGYVVVDEDTDELWVRTFIYHDGILTMPQMAMKMAAAFDAVDSAAIRQRIIGSLPPLLREGFPGNLQGTRAEAIEELKRADAATFKPPPYNPSDNGRGNGCTTSVDNGSDNPSDNGSGYPPGKGQGMGKGQGSRFRLDAAVSNHISRERVTGIDRAREALG